MRPIKDKLLEARIGHDRASEAEKFRPWEVDHLLELGLSEAAISVAMDKLEEDGRHAVKAWLDEYTGGDYSRFVRRMYMDELAEILEEESSIQVSAMGGDPDCVYLHPEDYKNVIRQMHLARGYVVSRGDGGRYGYQTPTFQASVGLFTLWPDDDQEQGKISVGARSLRASDIDVRYRMWGKLVTESAASAGFFSIGNTTDGNDTDGE